MDKKERKEAQNKKSLLQSVKEDNEKEQKEWVEEAKKGKTMRIM